MQMMFIFLSVQVVLFTNRESFAVCTNTNKTKGKITLSVISAEKNLSELLIISQYYLKKKKN